MINRRPTISVAPCGREAHAACSMGIRRFNDASDPRCRQHGFSVGGVSAMAVLLLCFALGAKSPKPTTTTTPSSRPSLPREFAVFQAHNPFATGGGSARGAAAGAASGPETSLAFKGVADTGGQFTAFIEDLSSKTVSKLAVGDALAQGSIKSINLDAIEYEVGGVSRRIEVGQNLRGEVVPPTPPATKPSGEPATAPAPGPPDGQPGSAAPQGPSGRRARGPQQ
jgi:hypothetical protein